jgi:hypothetical protein
VAKSKDLSEIVRFAKLQRCSHAQQFELDLTFKALEDSESDGFVAKRYASVATGKRTLFTLERRRLAHRGGLLQSLRRREIEARRLESSHLRSII